MKARAESELYESTLDTAIEGIEVLGNRIDIVFAAFETKFEYSKKLEKKVTEMNLEISKLKLEIAKLQLKKKFDSKNAGGLDKQLIEKIRRLCHPDRHGNSALSNSVTAELNKILRL
jgi:hypothetical protein